MTLLGNEAGYQETSGKEHYTAQWDSGFEYMTVTIGKVRVNDDSTVQPLVEKWIFNQEYELVKHELEGYTEGDGINGNTTIKTEHLDYVNQIPLKTET